MCRVFLWKGGSLWAGADLCRVFCGRVTHFGQVQICVGSFCGRVAHFASEQLQSVIWPFLKVFIKEHASEQLQCVICPFLKGFVKKNASEHMYVCLFLKLLRKVLQNSSSL